MFDEKDIKANREKLVIDQFEQALKDLARPVTPTPLTASSFNPDVLRHALDNAGVKVANLDPTGDDDPRTSTVLSVVLGGVDKANSFQNYALDYCRNSAPGAVSLIDYTADLLLTIAKIGSVDRFIRTTNWRVFKAHDFYAILSDETRQKFDIPDSKSTLQKTYRKIHPIPPSGPLDVWKKLLDFNKPTPSRIDLA